jgi:hypothetical protein
MIVYIYSIRLHALCLLQSLWENLILLRPVRLYFKKLVLLACVADKYNKKNNCTQNTFFRLLLPRHLHME